MPVAVRFAGTDDWPFISDISRRAGYVDYINEIGPDFVRTGEVVILTDGMPKGFAKIEKLRDGSLWLSGLRVAPEYQRTGVGTRLTTECIRIARSRGIQTLRMLVQDSNYASVNLASKIGFRKVATFRFFRGTPGIWKEMASDVSYSGFVNIGWAFPLLEIHDAGGTIVKVDDWILFRSPQDTFQILKVGRAELKLTGDDFTCADVRVGEIRHISESSEGEILTDSIYQFDV